MSALGASALASAFAFGFGGNGGNASAIAFAFGFGGDGATFSGGGQFEGSATNKAIFWNAQSIAENITITGTHNAGSIGPSTITSGFTVTVDSGARWVVI